jgi:C1A family cysteine protease
LSNNTTETRTSLIEEKAQWIAQSTALDKLSIEQKSQMLGAVPPYLPPLYAIRGLTPAAQKANFPSIKDWRNIAGANYTTPAKEQGLCQSCVAFSICAAVESAVKIAQNNPNFTIDVSEAHLFYCHGDANPCQNGWWPSQGLDIMKNRGVALESFYPYTAGNQVCQVGVGWESQKVQIKGWHTISDISEIKNWIADKGPVIACMEIFSDMHSYQSGVYHHLTGESLGWHSVCVVGYNDIDNYWICKNCWGSAFGDNGFINIAYGEGAIERYGMFAIDGVVESRWVKSKKVLALWANNKENNAWGFIEGEGWNKVYAGNRLTFLQILLQLVQAKNKATPVNVRLYNNEIKEIYS